MPPAGVERLQLAREAACRGAWSEVIAGIGDAKTSAELAPADLDVLAEAFWWNGRLDDCIGAHERAYEAYAKAGERAAAAWQAIHLAWNYRDKLAPSVSAGWRNRAARLLRGQPESVEHGWMSALDSLCVLGIGDNDAAVGLAEQAVECGARYHESDLVAVGLAILGVTEIHRGRVSEGLRALDEATAAAASSEVGAFSAAVTYCITIDMCHELADYGRAGEWAATAKRWCEHWDMRGFPGQCRVHAAEVDRIRGNWAVAEHAIRQACAEVEGWSPRNASAAFYELAEIQLRMGDLDASDESFRRAHELGLDPQPGLSLLRLAQGRIRDANALMTTVWQRRKATMPRRFAGALGVRALRLSPFVLTVRPELADESANALGRARLLPAQVEIALANGDIKTARNAARALGSVSETFPVVALQAAATQAAGAVDLAAGDPINATERLSSAVSLWQQVGAPYEAARARTLLAQAYDAAGAGKRGALELRAALTAFKQLGARLDVQRTAAQLGEVLGDRVHAEVVRGARRTFMFTDIVSSTNLVHAIGDEAWADLRRWHDRALRELFVQHHGQEIDHAGDGFFVAFEKADGALECAIAIQRRFAEHRATHGFAPQLRIGLHATDVIREGATYLGRGVHEAARIASLADGGEIIAGEQALDGMDRIPRSALREVTVRGVPQPLKIAWVEWR
jgi:class 3 adenylate cyclase